MTGPHRLEPPYAGLADLFDSADLPVPVLPPTAVPAPRRTATARDAGSPEVAGEPLGHRVTRRFFSLCEDPRTRDRTMRLVRGGAHSAVGGRLLVAFASRVVFRPALRSRRLDHTAARVELACAQLGGIAVLRYVSRMEPVASMSLDDLVAMVGPGVDATLRSPYRGASPTPDGDEPPTPAGSAGEGLGAARRTPGRRPLRRSLRRGRR